MSFPEAIDLRRVRVARPSVPRLNFRIRRPSRMGLLLAALVLALVLAGSWLLVRNSSLVGVQNVRVVGLSGYYDREARGAVVAEAMQMTTLNFDPARIEEAAAQFVDVADVRVETDFPNGATIHVDVRRPVLVARINGRTVTLSRNGEVITAPQSIAGLPQIEAVGSIKGNRVTGGKALEASRLLGAAPDVLLRKVDKVRWGRFGIVVTLDKGTDLYFGDPTDVRKKWRDAAAVLASPEARGAAYVDLRIPGRPSVGGLGGAPVAQSTAVTPDATSTATEVTPAETQAPAAETTAPAETTPPAATQPPTQTHQQTSPAAGGAGPNG